MHGGIAAITGNMHRSLRYFVLLEHITSIYVGMYAYVKASLPLRSKFIQVILLLLTLHA